LSVRPPPLSPLFAEHGHESHGVEFEGLELAKPKPWQLYGAHFFGSIHSAYHATTVALLAVQPPLLLHCCSRRWHLLAELGGVG
jgi:hypothetical protein